MRLKKLSDIVNNDLCLGCGLCQSITGTEKIKISMTESGCLEPKEVDTISKKDFNKILETCPGIKVDGLEKNLTNKQTKHDLIWGHYLELYFTYATDKHVRYISSTGGMLNALAIHLLETKKVECILHTGTSLKNPLRNSSKISFSKKEIIDSTTSRYGPSSSLDQIFNLLNKKKSFAIIGKPCDISAINNLQKIDSRIKKLCKYKLSLVCGGISKLTKSLDALTELGLKEKDLTLFRYRGCGNPGKLTIKTKNKKEFLYNYNDFWGDESKWKVLFRCKICPDAIGESADIVALDVWPEGVPEGDDAGYNGAIVRTNKGKQLIDSAIKNKHLFRTKDFGPRDLDYFQPHQVNKKKAVFARLEGMKFLNKHVPKISNLRIKKISKNNSYKFNKEQFQGIALRLKRK